MVEQNARLFSLNTVWKENSDIYRRMAKSIGLTETELWILYTLRVEPGEITQSRMCEFLHEPKQTVNSALKKMEAGGLLVLESGQNRRAKTIRLTETGLRLAQKTVDRVWQTETLALSQFSEEDAERMFALMRRMNALMVEIFPTTAREEEET